MRMHIPDLHPWNVTYKEAVEIQQRLRHRVILKGVGKKVKYIAGLDVSYAKGADTVWAGAVVLNFSSLVKTEERWSQKRISFPYIPGLLSFREIPALLDVLGKLEVEPDLILCDGQGIAHPRGLGLASHLGILLNKPTLGCAKTKLVGEFNPVGEQRGDYAYLTYQDRVIGAVVRTRPGVKPVYVSPGYGVLLKECIRFVLETCSVYRIPEPIRQAHILVNSIRCKGI
jgi:deoxyribonuclease V